MKTTTFRLAAGAVIILIAAALHGCNSSSVVVEESKSAGFNGGFEIEKAGLPVNWIFWAGEFIRKGDIEVSLDAKDAVEGKQSLKFLVHKVNPAGGWPSAGMFQVLRSVKAEGSYKVSFWLKNQGCKIDLTIRNEGKDRRFPSEAEKKDIAEHPPIKKTLGEEETGANKWRQFEYLFVVPKTDNSLRFDLNITQPGTLWIDDVRIVDVQIR